MLLAHLSDLHFGGADEEALAAARACLAERRPDAIIVSGDVTRAGLMTEFEAAFAWIRSLPAPALVVPGNHDVPYYEILGRIARPFARFEHAARGVRVDAWREPAFSVVPLNTARGLQPRFNWALGALSETQIAGAVAELAAAAPGALRIVTTHHPLVWPAGAPIRGRTWNGERAQRALVEAGAQIFLSGHLHASLACTVQNGRAVAISAGTLSRRLRHEPCGFALIQREDAGVALEFVRIVHGQAVTAEKRNYPIADV